MLSDWLSCYGLHQMCQVLFDTLRPPPRHNYNLGKVGELYIHPVFWVLQHNRDPSFLSLLEGFTWQDDCLVFTKGIFSVCVSAINLLPQFLVFLYSLSRMMEEKTCTVWMLLLTLLYPLVIPVYSLLWLCQELLCSKNRKQVLDEMTGWMLFQQLGNFQ